MNHVQFLHAGGVQILHAPGVQILHAGRHARAGVQELHVRQESNFASRPECKNCPLEVQP
jgi:hypothetical protein